VEEDGITTIITIITITEVEGTSKETTTIIIILTMEIDENINLAIPNRELLVLRGLDQMQDEDVVKDEVQVFSNTYACISQFNNQVLLYII
jgi:hypothetical protein